MEEALPGNILSTRQRDILLALLRSDGPITLTRLAHHSRINPRMVRYTLNTVEAWLRLNQTKVIRRPGFGIYIDLPKARRNQLIRAIERMGDFDLVLTSQQRSRAILLYVLVNPKAVTATELARQLEVSRSTIFRDFRNVEQWLGKYGLTLQRSERAGVLCQGSEAVRRFALCQLIHDELGSKNWVGLSEELHELSLSEGSVMDQFRAFLDTLDLEYCRRLVVRIERGLGYELTRAAQTALQLKLAVSIRSMKEGLFETAFHAEGIQEGLEYQIAQLVATDIEKRLGLSLGTPELELLAVHIQHAQVSPSLALESDLKPGGLPNSKHFIGLAQAIISKAATQLHPWLLVDPRLTIELAIHLSTAIPYLQYGFSIRNKLWPQIKAKYPNVWEVTRLASEALLELSATPIPDEEIGYLTVYFAAALERLRKVEELHYRVALVSDEENSFLALLHARLTAEFPSIHVATIANSLNATQVDQHQYDLVLTTYPLDSIAIPTIEIGPFLTPEDIEKIRSWLTKAAEDVRLSKNSSGELPSLMDLLDIKNIICGGSVTSWTEAVEKAGAPLVSQGKTEQRYIQAMKEVLTQYGPFAVIAPGVAVLHARPSDGVVSLCVGLLLLTKGVDFGHKDFDPVDVVFVLGAINESAHLLALKQIVSLIRDRAFLGAIRSSNTPSDVLRAVWKHVSEA